MNRPEKVHWIRPEKLSEYPTGPGFNAGHLVTINAGWRTFRPVIDLNKCTTCLRCYLVCPDGTIYKKYGKVAVEYDFCKGCGVCAHECKVGAICMEKEDGNG
ncbi:4Fe-4S binding protein [bacterium]|nr:4Fe-4S binding protein [bacterium]